MPHVDAVLSANVYCNRRLNELLKYAIAPFWADVKERHQGETCLLWLLRYGKCGEHVKLRFFGSEEFRATVRSLLPTFLASFFANPMSDLGTEKWLSKPAIPAVDPEDEATADYPNRSFLWTSYRRSPVLIGAWIYVADDRHVDLYNRSQAAVTEIVLNHLAPAFGRQGYFRYRQREFLKILISSLSVLEFNLAKAADYLTYHRDWLVRTLVQIPGTVDAESLVAELEEKVWEVPAGVGQLSDYLCRREFSGAEREGYLGPWVSTLGDFYDHVQEYRGRPEYDQDPCTRDFSYLPLFKSLHGAANQFGFRLSNEAYVHSLLLCAVKKALEERSQSLSLSSSIL